MTPSEREVMNTLTRLIEAVNKQDVRTYRDLVTEDVSSFETDIAPYRIDSLEFHIDLMSRLGKGSRASARNELLSPRVQLYGDFAIATYTRLTTLNEGEEVRFITMNETRVFVKEDGVWKMAHLHRSPAGENV